MMNPALLMPSLVKRFALDNKFDPTRVDINRFKPKDLHCKITIAGLEFAPHPNGNSIGDDYFIALVVYKQKDTIKSVLSREIFERVTTADLNGDI